MRWVSQSDGTLLLVLESAGHDQGLTKLDIHISVKIRPDGAIRWSYLHHQPYERAAVGIPWTAGPPDRWPVIGAIMETRISSQVAVALTDLLLDIRRQDTDTQKPPSLPEGFERRKILMLLLGGAYSRMKQPDSKDGLVQAVTAIRTASGMSQARFALACYTNLRTIVWLEKGKRSAAPSTLRHIADMGHRVNEWKAAEFLESLALMEESKIRTKGGHR